VAVSAWIAASAFSSRARLRLLRQCRFAPLFERGLAALTLQGKATLRLAPAGRNLARTTFGFGLRSLVFSESKETDAPALQRNLFRWRYRAVLPCGTRMLSPDNKKPAFAAGSLKRMKGLEPSTFCMASRRSSQLSYIRERAPV
jgi:hypothetical protein